MKLQFSLRHLMACLIFSCFFPLNADSLKIGLTGKYPPFNYFDQNSNLTGFDVEIASALCEKLRRPCEFKTLQWDGILGALLAGHIDVIIGSMAVTPERAQQVLFSEPYYISGAQLFVRDVDAEPNSKNYRIGVTLGTSYDSFVRKNFPSAELRTYKGDTEVLQDIIAGRLDAMVTDRLVGLHLNKMFNANLFTKGEMLYEEKIAIPARKENSKLISDLNTALAVIRQNQTYEKIYAKYFGQSSSETYEAQQKIELGFVAKLMLKGLWNTAKLAVLGLLLGFVCAVFCAALMLMLPQRLVWPLTFWTDFIRSTPFLVQLFAIYFGLPALGFMIGAWTAGVLAIALHSSAYLSEIFKSAYQSIPPGQHHAAAVLGFSKRSAFVKIILPQMFPLLMVPTLNTTAAMIKDSAIVSVIGVYELTLQAQQLISTTFKPMEFYALTALLYFCLTYPLFLAGKYAEKSFRKRGLLHDVHG